jgi:hypothetical protein
MKRAVARSIAVAGATLLLIGAAHLVHDVALCSRHRVWKLVHDQRSPVIRDSGYAFARPGDAIYACVTPHALGPIIWHQDLDCYCAPATLGAEALSRVLGGQCVVDQAVPARSDGLGACRHGHCSEHLDP